MGELSKSQVDLLGKRRRIRDAMAHARLLELFQVYTDVSSALAPGDPLNAATA